MSEERDLFFGGVEVPIISNSNQEYINLYLSIINTIEMQQAIPIYTHETDVCSISLENINDYDYYYKCTLCKCNTKMFHLKTWLKQNQSCPKCRMIYKVFPYLYQKRTRWGEFKKGVIPWMIAGAFIGLCVGKIVKV